MIIQRGKGFFKLVPVWKRKVVDNVPEPTPEPSNNPPVSLPKEKHYLNQIVVYKFGFTLDNSAAFRIEFTFPRWTWILLILAFALILY